MQHENARNLDLIKAQPGSGSDLNAALRATKAAPAKSSQPASAQAAGKAQPTEAEKKRWKASLDFESMFLGQMYKAMRKSDSFGTELTEASPGREIFTEMLDQEYAQMHSKSPVESGTEGLRRALSGVSNGLAAQIYRTLTRNGQDSVPAVDGSTPAADAASIFGAASAGEDASEFSPMPGLARMLGRRDAKSPAPKALPEISGAELNPILDLASKTFGVSRDLIQSVVKHESDNRPQAVSTAGAKGLMQLMDTTAHDMGVKNVFNPKDNVLGGTRYLKQLLERYGNDEKLALAAYNAGPAQVDRFKGVPPFAETLDYVKKILKTKADLASQAR
jgi:Rod binding domain-containing protein